MRRSMNILLLCCVVALAACTPSIPAPTATLPPSATPLPSPTATLTATSTPTATLTATPPPTATPRPTNTEPAPTQALEAASTATGDLDLLIPTGQPQLVWNGLPVMPGATSGAEKDGAYYYVAKGDEKSVQSYYDRELPKLGYSPFAIGTGDNGSLMLMYMKAEKLLVISVFPVKGFTLVMITAP